MSILIGCQSRQGASPPGPMPGDVQAVDLPGLENVVAFGDRLYSGSAPSSPESFAVLESLGVRTILSVDGASPLVGPAASSGMRTIHLPIGYDGISDERQLQLARATRDALEDGAVYVHCHHGRHRSAAAAGTVQVLLGRSTNEAMLRRMEIAGTSPFYDGLFRVVAEARPVDAYALDAIDGDFPSESHPTELVQSMVALDDVMEELRLLRENDWKARVDHPDLSPLASASRLTDLLRTCEPLDAEHEDSAVFHEHRNRAVTAAKLFEHALESRWSIELTSRRFDQVSQECTACHSAIRN